MPNDFLTPRIDRLSSDGKLHTLAQGSPLGRLLQKPVVLVARDLCSFSLLKTDSLPQSRRRKAAQLHGRTMAPFIQSGLHLAQSRNDFGIWWWDAGRVNGFLERANLNPARVNLYPETVSQPSPSLRGEQWRIVKLAAGYEAQLWRDRALVASAWRLDRYDTASWTAFVRLQRGLEQAPEQPPAPVTLAHISAPRQLSSVEISPQTASWIAIGSAATASLCLAAYVLGQTWQLQKDTEAVKAETAQIRASTPQADAVANLNEAQKMLVSYSQIEARTNPLSAAGAAIGILAYHEVIPQKLESSTDAVRVVIGYHHLKIAGTLVSDLNTSGYFYDVQPRTDAPTNTITIDMKVHEAAPPLETPAT